MKIVRVKLVKGMPRIRYTDMRNEDTVDCEMVGIDEPSNEFLQALDALKPALISDARLDKEAWAEGRIIEVTLKPGEDEDQVILVGQLVVDEGKPLIVKTRPIWESRFTAPIALEEVFHLAQQYVYGGQRRQAELNLERAEAALALS